jgi:hypothetical protein
MQPLNFCLIFYSKQIDLSSLKNSQFYLEVVSKPSIRFKVKAGRGIQTQEYIYNISSIENERERRRGPKDAVSGCTLT